MYRPSRVTVQTAIATQLTGIAVIGSSSYYVGVVGAQPKPADLQACLSPLLGHRRLVSLAMGPPAVQMQLSAV